MAIDAYTQVHSLSTLGLEHCFNYLARSGSNLIDPILRVGKGSFSVNVIKPKKILLRNL